MPMDKFIGCHVKCKRPLNMERRNGRTLRSSIQELQIISYISFLIEILIEITSLSLQRWRVLQPFIWGIKVAKKVMSPLLKFSLATQRHLRKWVKELPQMPPHLFPHQPCF